MSTVPDELLEAKSYGEVAYISYAMMTEGKTYDGRDMPAWSELTPKIQSAWQCSAFGVIGLADEDRANPKANTKTRAIAALTFFADMVKDALVKNTLEEIKEEEK